MRVLKCFDVAFSELMLLLEFSECLLPSAFTLFIKQNAQGLNDGRFASVGFAIKGNGKRIPLSIFLQAFNVIV
ncbi:hypothetical protein D3C72_2215640 [compost metagenome]